MSSDIILNVLTVLEIIIVEFAGLWLLSKKKSSFWRTLTVYVLITAFLIVFMITVVSHLPDYGDGNGRFMVLGIFYFIPAILNFGGDIKSRIIIGFYVFSYGLFGFAAAVRVAYLFDERYLALAVLVVQTLIYGATFIMYIHFSKEQVIVYIQKANNQQKNILIRYTMVSFLLIIVYNNVMVIDGSMLKKLLVYVMLVYFVILTYRLLVSYLKADDDKRELDELAKRDKLTGFGNRLALYGDLEKLVLKGEKFYLVFLDLDKFKTVNDCCGHLAGDAYLAAFAQALKELAGTEAECYRLAGDEFICITWNEYFCDRFNDIQLPSEMKFLGVSFGIAAFPEDGKTLKEIFELADARMYKCKQGKRTGI